MVSTRTDQTTGQPPQLERRTLGPRLSVSLFGAASWRIVERNFLVYKRSWVVFAAGMFEPVLYLLSIGVGVGGLVGDFTLDDGSTVGYVEFVAPAMLATSAMNGAIFDSTFNIFFRLKYAKLYDAMLATPIKPTDVARGEITWALLRGAIYSAAFIVVMLCMGLVQSWWMLLALAGDGADRLRLRRRRDGADHVHAHAGRTSSTSSWRSCRCSCSPPRSSRCRPTRP